MILLNYRTVWAFVWSIYYRLFLAQLQSYFSFHRIHYIDSRHWVPHFLRTKTNSSIVSRIRHIWVTDILMEKYISLNRILKILIEYLDMSRQDWLFLYWKVVEKLGCVTFAEFVTNVLGGRDEKCFMVIFQFLHNNDFAPVPYNKLINS